MTRSRKVEKAIKENDRTFQATGYDWNGHSLEEFTNINATSFCPFINNKKLGEIICSKKGEGIIHRSYPTGQPAPNNHYRWVQLEDFKNVQICSFQRDGEPDYLKCEKNFKICQYYKQGLKR